MQRDRQATADRPRREHAGRAVGRHLFEPVRRVDRIEHRADRDQTELDGHDDDEPRNARPHRNESDHPECPQRPGHEDHSTVPEPRGDRTREPCADQSPDAGDGEGETVLPCREPEPPEHEDGEQRLCRHDQAIDQHRVEEQRPERGAAEDVAPALEQLPRPAARPAGRRRALGLRLGTADRANPARGQQEAHRVRHDRRHRPEHADQQAAERRPEHDGRPVRRLETRVRREQILRLYQGLDERAARRIERDVRRAVDDSYNQQLREAQPPEPVSQRHGDQYGEARQIRRDHDRPLAAELDPRPERDRQQRAHRPARRRERGDLGGSSVQHEDDDQRERAEAQPRAVCADHVRGPQPAEFPAQRPSPRNHARD